MVCKCGNFVDTDEGEFFHITFHDGTEKELDAPLCESCKEEAQCAAEFDAIPEAGEVDGLVAASDRRIAIGFERMRS